MTIGSAASFSQTAWNSIETTFQAILSHPFNSELLQGTLSEVRFLFYLKQDLIFLKRLQLAIKLLLKRTNNTHLTHLLTSFLTSISDEENSLHHKWKPSKAFPNLSTAPTPACLNYAEFFLDYATNQPFEIALATLVPCPWIYREVARFMKQNATNPNNPYQIWIDTYNDLIFSQFVDQLNAAANQLYSTLTSTIQQQMIHAFQKSSQFEWDFWNDAYHLS